MGLLEWHTAEGLEYCELETQSKRNRLQFSIYFKVKMPIYAQLKLEQSHNSDLKKKKKIPM